MSNVIKIDFEGQPVAFTEDGWFNATVAANRYGKAPHEWLRLPETRRYLEAVKRKYGEIPYLRTSRGRGGGTWLHPKLAVAFARWLDDDFAVWCDSQIDDLLRTGERRAMTVWEELQKLQLQDADSRVRASFGSRLMLDRKRALPGLRGRQVELEREFAPDMFKLSA